MRRFGTQFGLWLFLVPLAMLSVRMAPASPRQQDGQDPLTDQQVEQVRQVADQPNERIKLYLKFLEQRSSEIHQMVAHPHGQHPNAEIHNYFQEFTRLCDELQDNLDAYADEHADLRKALKDVIDHSAKWPAVLNEPPAASEYDFARKTALDAALSTNDQAKKLLREQDEYFAEHKPPK
jgi:exonuclease VII large subunit